MGLGFRMLATYVKKKKKCVVRFSLWHNSLLQERHVHLEASLTAPQSSPEAILSSWAEAKNISKRIRAMAAWLKILVAKIWNGLNWKIRIWSNHDSKKAVKSLMAVVG